MEECKYKPVERIGLYIMVFITMINSCNAIDRIDEVLELLSPSEVITENSE